MVTPGKWIARIDEYAIDVIEEKSGFGIADIGTRKSLKDANYSSEQAEANAKLIAAAPDLLEALLPFEKMHDEVFVDTRADKQGVLYAFNGAEVTYEDLRKLKAAIFKATE